MFNFSARKNSTFEIDSENMIVYIRLLGETFSSDIIKINRKLLDNHKLIKGFKWIFDISKCKILFSKNQIESISAIFKANPDLFQNVKMAIIISSPKQSVDIDSLISFYNQNNIDITIKKVIDIKQAKTWVLEN